MILLLAIGACTADPADPGGDPTAGTLSALTYNVHGLPDLLTNTERPGAERMARIAPLLAPYTLVGLQEDFDAANHGLLTDDAAQAIHHWFDDIFAPDRFYGSGLTLLADGEEVSYATEHYATCHGALDGASDCLASKGFQVLRLRLGGAELDVYNTHHEAGGGAEDVAARAAQVDQVLASIDRHSGDRAVLFMGDTNLHPGDPDDDPLLAAYAAVGLRDGCVEVACPEADRIDRFLVRDGSGLALSVTGWRHEAQFVDEDGVALSDHDALALTLDWERVAP